MRISVSSLCRHIQDIQQQDYIDCIGDCQRLFLSPTKKADQQRLRITLSHTARMFNFGKMLVIFACQKYNPENPKNVSSHLNNSKSNFD